MKLRFKNRKASSTPPATKQVVAVVCDDIEVITFETFLKCAINHDFTGLIVSGSPSDHQIFIAWVTVLSKYYELIGSKDSLRYIKTVAKMERLNLRIQVIGSLAQSLRLGYYENLIRELREWGYNREFTRDTMGADLDYVDRDVESLDFQLKKEKKEFDRMEHQAGRSGKATKESYMRTLYAIEQYYNRNGGRQVLHPRDITLYKFAILYNELVEYNEALKKAYGKY